MEHTQNCFMVKRLPVEHGCAGVKRWLVEHEALVENGGVPGEKRVVLSVNFTWLASLRTPVPAR